ncbi:MAG: NAD(P)H-hydrate dehydratase [Bacteroidales bacterium]|nr:NAD(P)H-hydrate dehydratase [Bacteroidales bacterium]
MKIFSANKTREADNYTIKNEPIPSVDLMERAASGATDKIIELYTGCEKFIIFAGPGNNGGDGLVIARLLAEKAFEVSVYFIKFTDKVSPDFEINFQRLKKRDKAGVYILESILDFPEIPAEALIIDAIFGSGLTRNLTGFPEKVVKKINETNNEVVSVDIPSGLFGEENLQKEKTVINANHTITFQHPSLSFLFPENEHFIGEFHIIDIGIHKDFINNTNTPYYYIQKADIKIKNRKKFSHKGNYGHTLILAGSYGKAGASILAISAAQRTGAGLVTASVPKCNYQILQISSPETMLHIDTSDKYISQLPDLKLYNSIAIGPGIGFNKLTEELLHHLIKNYNKPIVFDADAITILSQNKNWLKDIPGNSIFTPHPKEFERLVGRSKNNFERLQMQIDFARTYNATVILKGAHTSIALSDGKVYFNSSGNPGMATGGSGDVLTGIIVSLLAQNYKPRDAAITGTYLHGLAGDIAMKKSGQSALIASDIIEYLPEAFIKLKP